MIEAIFVFIVYLIITVVVFFNTRYKIISGQELDIMYQDAYKSFTEEKIRQMKENAESETNQTNTIIENASVTLDQYTGDALENENNLDPNLVSDLISNTEQENEDNVLRTYTYQNLLRTGLQAVTGFSNTTPYRNWSLTTLGGEEVFTGSKQLQLETEDGRELFIKVKDGDGYRYIGVNFFNAVETFYGGPRGAGIKGLYLYFETVEGDGSVLDAPLKVRFSTSRYLKATSNLLTKDLKFKKINDFSDLDDVNDTLFLLKVETERNETGILVPFGTPNAENTRFVIRSIDDHLVYYDIEMEIPAQDDERAEGDYRFYIKNNKGLYMTVNTDYFDAARGQITFTQTGTPLYLFSDMGDQHVYRITTRTDSFGLFLTIFNTFNLYNRDGDVATLDNTKFKFYIINNDYTRPYYYPECVIPGGDDRSLDDLEIWNEKCHTKCSSIDTPNPVDPRSDQTIWFRDYESDEDGNIIGGNCKRYGECPKGYYKKDGLCYEDCRMRGPGWFNGSMLECAHCGDWKSDGALGCTPDGGAPVTSFLTTVFSFGQSVRWRPWSDRSTRKSKGPFSDPPAGVGAMNQVSDNVSTETGMDGVWGDIYRTQPAFDVSCKNGGELVYIDASGKEHDKNTINIASDTYTLMCRASCYNNLYDDDEKNENACIRKNFDNASTENF